MVLRLILGVVFLAAVTGCATTGARNSHEQMQTRVTELEKKIEEKDSEIVDLQYQVKDISSRVSTKDSSDDSYDDEVNSHASGKSASSYAADEIIRVNASVEDVQSALKAAGVYSGKIDGKAGSGTKAAIKAFQKQNQLSADGILGRKTWKLLKSYLK